MEELYNWLVLFIKTNGLLSAVIAQVMTSFILALTFFLISEVRGYKSAIYLFVIENLFVFGAMSSLGVCLAFMGESFEVLEAAVMFLLFVWSFSKFFFLVAAE